MKLFFRGKIGQPEISLRSILSLLLEIRIHSTRLTSSLTDYLNNCDELMVQINPQASSKYFLFKFNLRQNYAKLLHFHLNFFY